jgi:thioredoxin-like negative regulator of GroEL
VDNPKNITKNESVDDLIAKGWSFHASAAEEDAEEYFRAACDKDARSIEALYGLALVLKSQGRRKEAVKTFKQLIGLLELQVLSDKVRSTMLRRLAKGHINEIETGDWNLEEEIWQKKN